MLAVLADRAYDIGYALGSIVGALLLGYVVMWVWGLVRNHAGDRMRSAWAWANHWRSLAAAGFLWALSVLGSNVG